MKKMITEKDYDTIDFEKSIDSVISMLQKAKVEGWTDIYCDYSYNTVSYNFCKRRIETDKEYNARILEEETSKEYRRKQYEDLKKEFGDE